MKPHYKKEKGENRIFLFLVLLLTVGCATQETGIGQPSSQSAIKHIEGAYIYERNCAACHGNDGVGAFAGVPNLTQVTGFSSKEHSDTELFEHIKHVKQGIKTPGSTMAMPPKGGNPDLTDQDIRKVLEYMRERFVSE